MPRPPMKPKPEIKNTKKTLKRLIKYMFREKALLTGLILFTLISSVASVCASLFIQPIIDKLFTQIAGTHQFSIAIFEPVKQYMIFMIVVFVLGFFTAYGRERCIIFFTQKTLRSLRKDLFDSVADLPISFYDSVPNGEIMSRFTNDVESLRMFLSQSLSSIISSLITITGSFILMIYYGRWLTLIVIAMLAIMLFLTKKLGSKSANFFKKQQDEIAKVNGFVEETISGQKVVKIFNHEDEIKDEFFEKNEKLRKASTGANTFASILMPIMNNLTHLNYAICASVGAVTVIKGIISPGSLIAFLTYSRNFSMPIVNTSQQFNNAIMAIAGAERIFDYLDEQAEKDEGYVTLVNAKYDGNGDLCECEEHTGLWAWKHTHSTDNTVTYTKLEGKVEFENVSFSYDGRKTVLNNISLYANPGQKIAFVGSTGAGKTTITNLINRFYDISEGKIRYDGINIKKIKKDDLRRSLAMVLQDTHLFTGTVEDNIRYGNLDASREQIENAAKLANAHDFIMALPQGYDTVLTRDGSNLSQGQRQLLAIARAAVADPPVLILDEATSSIDTRTEKLIEQGMDKLMNGRTVFVIAHRLSTVRNAKAIMVLEHGEIIERGDHEELLRQKGRYYQLYTGQFELT
mgnify:CR=1 FL=1